ncbi:MAG: carbon-nitrogen hydrolase [Pseudomonadota bacterium]
MSERKAGRALTVALVQTAPGAAGDRALEEALALSRDAAGQGAELVVLPELFAGPYFCQVPDAREFARAETIPGPTTSAFCALAGKLGVSFVVSLFERRAVGLYHNTAVMIDRTGIVGTYRKMHIPDDPGYGEKFFFTPGDTGFGVHRLSDAVVGTLVCWDQWFPEAARLTALRGAELLVYPTAIGWHPFEKATLGDAQLDAWRTVQRSHAIANGCYVLAVNRTGFEKTPGGKGGGIEFWGHSFIAGPDGQIIAEASADRPEVLMATLDLDHIREMREGWPFLRDRRIDAYADLTRRFIDDGKL